MPTLLLTVSYSLFPKVRDSIGIKLSLTAAVAATGTTFYETHKNVFVELKQLCGPHAGEGPIHVDGDGLPLFVEEVTSLAFTHIPYTYSY